MASKTTDPRQLKRADVNRILAERGVTGLRNYDGETHEGLFFVPKYIRDAFDECQDVIRDDKPLTYKMIGDEKNAR
jgi:spermidine synthase